MSQRDAIIRVEGLTTHYGTRRILNDINLEIQPRETMVLLGSRSEERRVGKECRL